MPNERWDAIEALFHAARELQDEERVNFLDKECKDDAIRRQVEALLRGDERTEGILNTTVSRIAMNTRIGPYEVIGWLGAGGMGEVYRARDPRLGRDVAIKLLPTNFATDEVRTHRFEQEARAAAQLNHPNILAVYDVGLHAGTPYIVSELLAGQSLRSFLSGSALPPRRAIDFARQIVEGLAAAHEKGIIHRDIKPENIFVTSEGRVKILDFGLAKFRQPDEDAIPTKPRIETQTGTVMGTVTYMSPEQVRGETVDHRSDIFSFGVVLYEMLSGRPSFTRETTADTMAAILKEDPPGLTSPGIPPALARIVSRCLEKTRETRFQSGRDLAFGLEFLSGEANTATSVARPASRLLSRRELPWAVGGVLLLGAAAAVVLRKPATPTDAWQSHLKYPPRKLIDWNHTQSQGEISPDGKWVAFLSNHEGGGSDIFQVPVGSANPQPLNLTADFPKELRPPPVSPLLRNFGFTGDPLRIWFSPPEGRATNPLSNTEPKQYIPIGAVPQLPLEEFPGLDTEALAWSKDNRIAYISTQTGGDVLWVIDAPAANPTQILENQKEGMHNHNPVWSPGGEWIYFVSSDDPALPRADDVSVKTNLWRVRPLKHAKPDQLTFQNAAINYLAPIDDSRVLYTARGPDGTGPWLWEHDVNTHVTEQVRLGPNPCVAVSASADGRIVAATLAEYPTVGLYSVPIRDNGMAKEIDVKPFEVQGTRPHAPRFDESGKSMFYLSASKAFDGLSLMRNGKDSVILDGSNVALFEPPAVSRDGKRVVIVVRQGGLRRLEIRSDEGIAGSALNTSITVQGSAGQSVADWGPGNEWIVVGGSDDEGKGLFKIPVGEGKGDRHEVLVRGPATNPVVSPKGDLIVYAGPLGKGQSELGFVTPDGQPVPSLTGMHLKVRPGGYRFLPDGSGLVFTRIQGPLDFFLLDLRTRSSDRQLAQLGSKGRISTFDVTPDKRIVFDRTIENSAIFLIDHI